MSQTLAEDLIDIDIETEFAQVLPSKRRQNLLAMALGVAAFAGLASMMPIRLTRAPAPVSAPAEVARFKAPEAAPVQAPGEIIEAEVATNDSAGFAQGLVEKAQSKLESDDVEGALELFQQATLVDPHATAAWYGVAFCATELHHDTQALVATNHARWENPLDLKTNVLAGFLAQEDARFHEARELYRRSLMVAPQSSDRHELHAVLGNLPKTIRRLRQQARGEKVMARFHHANAMSGALVQR